MERLLINNEKTMNGSMSIQRSLEDKKLVISGLLKTHKYIEEITSIESSRYKVKGVIINKEAFGTDDFFILYSFIAKELIIKGGESYLTDAEIEKKEKEAGE